MIPVYFWGMANAETSKQVTHYFTNRFKRSFRNWELLKLFLRIIVPIIIIVGGVTNYEEIAKCFTGFLFLFLMIVNSTFKPANTGLNTQDITEQVKRKENPPHFWSNAFESLCFMVLAFVSFSSHEQSHGDEPPNFVTPYYITILPFVIFIIYKCYTLYKYCQKKFNK